MLIVARDIARIPGLFNAAPACSLKSLRQENGSSRYELTWSLPRELPADALFFCIAVPGHGEELSQPITLDLGALLAGLAPDT